MTGTCINVLLKKITPPPRFPAPWDQKDIPHMDIYMKTKPMISYFVINILSPVLPVCLSPTPSSVYQCRHTTLQYLGLMASQLFLY